MSNHYRVKQVILMRTDLRNTKGQRVRSGKLMAQAAHASMGWLVDLLEAGCTYGDLKVGEYQIQLSAIQREWLMGDFAKVVLEVESEQQLLCLLDSAQAYGIKSFAVYDNGTTEFGGVQTLTCGAIGPDMSDEIDKITGHLKPL